jgi:hypothetical protein
MFGRLGMAQPNTIPSTAMPYEDAQPAQPAHAPRRSWFEGGKFGWKDGLALTLGALGDAMQQAGGGQATFLPLLTASRKHQRDLADAAAQRKADVADWIAKEQWKRANPQPVNNDTVADYDFIRSKLGDKAGEEFLRNKANPPVWRQGPDGQFYRVDTPQATSIGALPTFTQDDWDKAGGSAGNGTGGFR